MPNIISLTVLEWVGLVKRLNLVIVADLPVVRAVMVTALVTAVQ
jgi:hypothetical protein